MTGPLETVAGQLVERATPLVGQLAHTPIAALSDERLFELGARIVAILALRTAGPVLVPPPPLARSSIALSAGEAELPRETAPISLAARRRGITHAAMSDPDRAQAEEN